MADKGLRDLFPRKIAPNPDQYQRRSWEEFDYLIIENMSERIKLAAVGFIRAIKNKVKPDVVEKAYQDLIIGKYKGRSPVNATRRQLPDEPANKVNPEGFTEEIERTFPSNPYDMGGQNTRVIDGVIIKLTPDTFNRGDFNLDSIMALEQGKGRGSAALKKITDIADKHGITIRLQATPLRSRGGVKSTASQLHKFYEKAGFTMTRPAKELRKSVEQLAKIQEEVLARAEEIMDEGNFDMTISAFMNKLTATQRRIVGTALEGNPAYNPSNPIDDFENLVISTIDEAFTASGGASGIRLPQATAKPLRIPFSDMFGRIPSERSTPKTNGQWVAEDMGLSPEQRVTQEFKTGFLKDEGIELSDHDEIVWKHENSLPRKKQGSPVELGAAVKIREKLNELNILTAKESLQAVAATLVRQTKTASGLRMAYNLNRLFAMDDAIAKTVDIQFKTGYSRLLQKVGQFPLFGDLTNIVVRERFPRVLQEISYRYDGMISNFNQSISGEFFNLHKKYDDMFRDMNFSITEEMVPVKGKVGVTSPGKVRKAFEDIDRLEKDGVYSTDQAHALKLGIMFQDPTKFKIPKKKDEVLKRLSNMMDDSFRMEIMSGAFRGSTEQAASELDKVYLPQIWQFDKSLLDDAGFLTDAGFEKIFGTKQFFEKSREWNDIALAVGVMAKRETPIRLAEEIKSPLDLIAARLMASGRILSDKILNDDVAKALDSGLINTEQARSFKSILSGGSGELRGASEKAISSLVDMTLAGPLRMIRFSTDLGILGVQAYPAINYLAVNPLKTIKMAGTIIKYLMRPEAFIANQAANPERWARFSRAGGKFGQEGLQKDTGGDWIELLPRLKNVFKEIQQNKAAGTLSIGDASPIGGTQSWKMPEGVPLAGDTVVYNPIKLMNEMQFSRVMAIIKLNAFEMESDILWSNSPWNKALRKIQGSGIISKNVSSQLEADLVAAHGTNEGFGGLSNARALQGKGFRKLLTPILLTPDFAQATMAKVLRGAMTPTTPEGAIARGFLVRLMAANAMVGTVAQMMWGGEEINFNDPTRSDFFVWKVAGDAINLLGRWGTHFKLMAAVPTDITDMFQGEFPRNMSDTQYDITESNTWNKMGSFINGRVSSPVELITRLKTQRAYDGTPLWDEDADPGIKEYALYAATHGPVPISITQIRTDFSNNEYTRMRAFFAFTGISQYPIDLVRENGKRALQTSLQEEIHAVTNNELPLPVVEAMARSAVNDRNSELGNRIRPNVIFDPRTNKRLDMDMDKVYTSMAIHLEYWDETRENQPDIERARRLGLSDDQTPQERKEHEEYMVKKGFEDIADIARERLIRGDAIEEQYGPGKEYPTISSAYQAIGKLMSSFSLRNRALHEKYGEVMEKLSDKRLEPTAQQKMFDLVRNILDETVNEDGSTDHWTRTRRMDKFDELHPEILDKFFEYDVSVAEAQLVRGWRQAVSTASEYYSIPARMMTKDQYEDWRVFQKASVNSSEDERYYNQVGRAHHKEMFILNEQVKITRMQSLEYMTEADLIATEVSLWLLDGREPQHKATHSLMQYHTGLKRPSATDFAESMDLNTLLDTLGRE